MNFKLAGYSSMITAFFLLVGCSYSNSQKELSTIDTKTEISKPIEQEDVNMGNENLQEIIQKSIDLPKLQQYFHIDELPNRAPLIILQSELIPSNLELNKFGKKVEIDTESNEAHLVFSKVDINQITGSIHFSYPVEGIRVEIQFIKNDHEWLIKESVIKEN